ncbi:MAG TPA: hypothetical protein DD412_06515 [Holosporales bacterium]|nr:hypothetical protein [Holosporales bacterium]
MKKTVLLPLVLSTALLSVPNTAKALPISDIIGGIKVATHIAVTAKPLMKMIYKAVKKGGKDLVRFIKNHRGHHKAKRRPVAEEENLIPPSTPALMPALVPVKQDLDEKFNTVALIPPQTYRYSHRVVRYEEETRYFGGGF